MTGFTYDVSVIGACGHVGLPLSIILAKHNLKVLGVDIHKEHVAQVQNKTMPFYEVNAQEILEKVINTTFFVTSDASKVAESEYIIITIETPLNEDFTVDLTKLERGINTLLPYFREGQTLILRSTLAPRTTDHLKMYIEKRTSFIIGKNLFLATVPERIAQNHAIEELESLPNIIGTYDDQSFERAKKLFTVLNPNVVRTTPLEAELTKLFSNSYRYANFALSNEYFIIAETLGANIFHIINAMNYKYARCNVPTPGFVKGPCLGKDSWLLINSMPHYSTATTMISSAYRINDGLPLFLLRKIQENIELDGKKVAVLGLTFKRDTDDTRDSLCLKFVNLLKSEFINYTTHDPFVDNKNISDVLHDADIIAITMNHTFYETVDFKKLAKPNALIVDKWNTLKQNKFILRVNELP